MTRLLLDTSIWIRFLRADASIRDAVRSAVSERGVVVCEPVVMELVSGARIAGRQRLLQFLDTQPTITVVQSLDFRAAGRLMSDARRRGHTIRSSMDALVAAVALRHDDVTLVHDDVDFDRIAEVAPLRHERWPRVAAS